MNNPPPKIRNQNIYIYLFDSQTNIYIGTISTATKDIVCPNDGTMTKPPEYDADFEQIIYNPPTETWKIVKLDNPLEETINSAKYGIVGTINSIIKESITTPIQDSGIYQLKYEEAIRYINKNAPKTLTNYPFLKAESAARKKTAKDCAEVVIEKHEVWNDKLNKMEAIRQTANAKIYAVEINSSAPPKIEKISQGAIEKLLSL